MDTDDLLESIQLVPTNKLVAWDDNPNSMPDQDWELLKHGIAEAGFLQPILVWERPDGKFELVDGHHRWRAAEAVGYTELPAHVLPCDYPAGKVQALRLALNRLRGQLSGTAVAKVIAEISREYPEMDITLTGYSSEEAQGFIDALGGHGSMDDILNEMQGAVVSDKADKPDKEYKFELSFSCLEDMKAAKTALRKAAGGPDLGRGVLVLARIE